LQRDRPFVYGLFGDDAKPTQDGRMCERNASIRHHDHQVSEAQFETCVPADAKNDDLSVEMPTGEQSLDRNKSTHPAMILHS